MVLGVIAERAMNRAADQAAHSCHQQTIHVPLTSTTERHVDATVSARTPARHGDDCAPSGNTACVEWPRPCSVIRPPLPLEYSDCGEGMDLYDTKSRIAEAFVESIFRRARYRVLPLRGAQALRIGPEDFSPNFGVATPDVEEPRYLVEVKSSGPTSCSCSSPIIRR